MNKEPYYGWDENLGMAYCILTYNNIKFKGEAICHPDDKDMKSKLTGQTIAEMRALLKVLRYKRDCELIPQLKSINQLYYAMNRSKQFNPKSYEAKMIFRHTRNIKNDLDIVNEEIASLIKNLKEYIEIKDKCYQSLRKQRADKNN